MKRVDYRHGDVVFNDDGLETSCAGTGMVNCFCGGDLCVCAYHGEAECLGCDDCQPAGFAAGEDDGYDSDYEDRP